MLQTGDSYNSHTNTYTPFAHTLTRTQQLHRDFTIVMPPPLSQSTGKNCTHTYTGTPMQTKNGLKAFCKLFLHIFVMGFSSQLYRHTHLQAHTYTCQVGRKSFFFSRFFGLQIAYPSHRQLRKTHQIHLNAMPKATFYVQSQAYWLEHILCIFS